MNSIRVGTGASILTPPLEASMAGYFEERRATAVHDDLHARALVLDDGRTRAAVVCCDLISVQADQVARVRELVEQQVGIPAAHVMVCGTHTHTGPHTRRERLAEGDVTLAWLEDLPGLVAPAVVAASHNMHPCSVAAGRVQEDRIAFNRRYRMRDGSVRSNPGLRHPEIVEPAGPIDPEVGVLAFSDAGGTLRSLFVNYACHLDNVGGTAISADFPGYLVQRLQERLPDRPGVVFANGACGDINHVDTRSGIRRKGHEHSRWMGETLAGDVCVALERPEPLAATPLLVGRQMVPLPVSAEADPAAARAEIQVIRMGDVGLVGVPAEYFVELQLDIKARSPLARTYVCELANDWVGYVPTRKAFEENMGHVARTRMDSFDHMGYEVRSALSRGYLPGVGETMADAAVALLEGLAGT